MGVNFPLCGSCFLWVLPTYKAVWHGNRLLFLDCFIDFKHLFKHCITHHVRPISSKKRRTLLSLLRKQNRTGRNILYQLRKETLIGVLNEIWQIFIIFNYHILFIPHFLRIYGFAHVDIINNSVFPVVFGLHRFSLYRAFKKVPRRLIRGAFFYIVSIFWISLWKSCLDCSGASSISSRSSEASSGPSAA